MKISQNASTPIATQPKPRAESGGPGSGTLGKVLTLGLPLLAQVAGARPLDAAQGALARPVAPGALHNPGRALQQLHAVNPQGLSYGGGLYMSGIGQASLIGYDASLTTLAAATGTLSTVGTSAYMMAALQPSQAGLQANIVSFTQRAPAATPPVTAGIIEDAAVQSAIAATLAGALPVSNPQLGQQMVLYVLPANVQAHSATRGTTSLGQCAYHDMVSVTVGVETAQVPYAVIPTTDPQGHCFPQVADPTEKLVIESVDQILRLALNPDHRLSDTAGYTVNGQDLVDACGLTPAHISDPRGQNAMIRVPQAWAFGACFPTN